MQKPFRGNLRSHFGGAPQPRPKGGKHGEKKRVGTRRAQGGGASTDWKGPARKSREKQSTISTSSLKDQMTLQKGGLQVRNGLLLGGVLVHSVVPAASRQKVIELHKLKWTFHKPGHQQWRAALPASVACTATISNEKKGEKKTGITSRKGGEAEEKKD